MSTLVERFEERDSSAQPRRRRSRRRSTGSRVSARVARLLVWGLALAVVGSALAIGAVHVVSTLVLSGFVAALLGVGLATRAVEPRLPAPALLAGALAGFTLLQAVPLPTVVLDVLAPANMEVWRGAYEVLGRAAPHWLPISLDPGASLLEALKWFAYAAAFTLAAAAARVRGAQIGALIVFSAAVVVALTTVLHRLAGAEAVFGLYQPVGEFSRASLGPLLNANNLAGYLNLGVFCGIGLMLSPVPIIPRWCAALGTAPMMGVALETGSRGGLVALALGLVTVGVGLASSRSELWGSRPQKRRLLLAVAGVGAFGCLLAVLAASPRLVGAVADKGVSKLAMAGWVGPLVQDYPWLGVGRGAFESAFQSYRIGQNNLIYSHPENVIAQWVAEWGLPVGLVALLAFAWLLRPKALGVRRNPVALGVLAALVVLILQNLVDLGLEIPAVALAAAVAAGACYGQAEHEGGVQGLGKLQRAAGWGMLLVPEATLVITLVVSPTPVGAARRELGQALRDLDFRSAADVQAFRATLSAHALAHPADPYFARLGGLVAFRSRDQPPMPWLDRALTLGLMSGRTHYLLATILAAWDKTDQALLELRFAATYDPALAEPIARAALRISSDSAVLVRSAPHAEAGVGLLLAMARKLRDSPERQGLRRDLLREAVSRGPNRSDARAELGKLLYSLLLKPEDGRDCSAAERASCLREAADQAQALERLSRQDSAGIELQAQLLLLQGDALGAERLLAERCRDIKTRRRCLLLRLKAAAQSKSSVHMGEAARATVASGCDTSEDCARLNTQVGDVLMGQAEYRQAVAYFRRAVQEEPSDGLWLKLANAAELGGEPTTALEALTRLERKTRDPKLRQRIDAQRRQAVLPSPSLSPTAN